MLLALLSGAVRPARLRDVDHFECVNVDGAGRRCSVIWALVWKWRGGKIARTLRIFDRCCTESQSVGAHRDSAFGSRAQWGWWGPALVGRKTLTERVGPCQMTPSYGSSGCLAWQEMLRVNSKLMISDEVKSTVLDQHNKILHTHAVQLQHGILNGSNGQNEL